MANSENSCLSPPPDDSGAGLVCSVEPPPELIPTNEGVDWRERRRVINTSGMVDLFREEIRRGKWEDAVLTANGLSPDDLKEQLGYADWDVPCSRLKMLRAARARPNNDSSRVVDALQPVAALLDALDAKKWEQVNKVLVGFADRDIAFVYKGLPESGRDDLERAATEDGVLPDQGARFIPLFREVRLGDKVLQAARVCTSGGPKGVPSENVVDYLILTVRCTAYVALCSSRDGRWEEAKQTLNQLDGLVGDVLEQLRAIPPDFNDSSGPNIGILSLEFETLMGQTRSSLQMAAGSIMSHGSASEAEFQKAVQGLSLSRDFLGAVFGDSVAADKVTKLASLKGAVLGAIATACVLAVAAPVVMTAGSTLLSMTPEALAGGVLASQRALLLARTAFVTLDAASMSIGTVQMLEAISGKDHATGGTLSAERRLANVIEGAIALLPLISVAPQGAQASREAWVAAATRLRSASLLRKLSPMGFGQSLMLSRGMRQLSAEERAILEAVAAANKEGKDIPFATRDALLRILSTKLRVPKDLLPKSSQQVLKELLATPTAQAFSKRFKVFGERALVDAEGDVVKAEQLLIERFQVARLPDGGGLVPPTHLGGELRHGIPTGVSLDEVFSRGLPQRGTSIDLLEYARAPGSTDEFAFRGTSDALTESGGGIAAHYAGDGGHVLILDGIPSWDIAKLLGKRSFTNEAESAIAGAVPSSRIKEAIEIHNVNGKLVYGKRIPNPNYKPK